MKSSVSARSSAGHLLLVRWRLHEAWITTAAALPGRVVTAGVQRPPGLARGPQFSVYLEEGPQRDRRPDHPDRERDARRAEADPERSSPVRVHTARPSRGVLLPAITRRSESRLDVNHESVSITIALKLANHLRPSSCGGKLLFIRSRRIRFLGRGARGAYIRRPVSAGLARTGGSGRAEVQGRDRLS